MNDSPRYTTHILPLYSVLCSQRNKANPFSVSTPLTLFSSHAQVGLRNKACGQVKSVFGKVSPPGLVSPGLVVQTETPRVLEVRRAGV